MEKRCFGVDIGGTTVKMGLFTVDGKVTDKWEIPTRKEENGKYILEDIAKSVKERMQRDTLTLEDIAGLGIGDRKSTRLNSSHSGQSRMPSSA